MLLSILEMAQGQPWRRGLGRCVGMKVLGGVVPTNEAVGVGVYGFGFLVFASLEVDIDGPATTGGVEAHGDSVSDQASFDLVDDALQADGTVLLNLAVELEEKQFIEVTLRAG